MAESDTKPLPEDVKVVVLDQLSDMVNNLRNEAFDEGFFGGGFSALVAASRGFADMPIDRLLTAAEVVTILRDMAIESTNGKPLTETMIKILHGTEEQ